MIGHFDIGARSKIIAHFIRRLKMDKETAVKAFNNYRNYYPQDWANLDHRIDRVSTLFIWDATPEGDRFWDSVYLNSRK